MFGGKTAHIDGKLSLFSPAALPAKPEAVAVTFDPRSSGQVALVIYEWADVAFLGTETPDETVGGGDLPVRGFSSFEMIADLSV
jgi:hypothetical protein